MADEMNQNLIHQMIESTGDEQREWLQLILEDDCINAFQALWAVAAECNGEPPDEYSTPEKLALLARLLDVSERYVVARASWLAGTPMINIHCERCSRFLAVAVKDIPITCPYCGLEGVTQPKRKEQEMSWAKGSQAGN
jgi:hypothetical protein